MVAYRNVLLTIQILKKKCLQDIENPLFDHHKKKDARTGSLKEILTKNSLDTEISGE